MNLLVISQVYWPDTASVAQHLSDLSEELSRSGHEVKVITSTNDYENPKKIYSKIDNHKGVEICRIANTNFGKKNKLTRVIDFLSFNLLISIKLLFSPRQNADVLLCLTSPPLLSYIAIRISRIKGWKFIYWTMDLQPELSVVAGYLNERSRATKSLQRKADYVFKHANLIITLDDYMKHHIYKRIKKISNIYTIPVWPIMNDIYQGEREENRFRIENDLTNKLVIMYSGNHSVVHPLNTLLEVAKKYKNDPRFIFVHIGSGVRIKEVKEFKARYNLNNIKLFPYQPRENVHLSLGAADIQVVILGNNCIGYTHPNKIYGAMYIAKPILYIGPSNSHVTDILDDLPGNISIRHGEVEKLYSKLKILSNQPESKLLSIGYENRKYAQNNFAPEILINKMVDVINKYNC